MNMNTPFIRNEHEIKVGSFYGRIKTFSNMEGGAIVPEDKTPTSELEIDEEYFEIYNNIKNPFQTNGVSNTTWINS